jgi:hypothetical protein
MKLHRLLLLSTLIITATVMPHSTTRAEESAASAPKYDFGDYTSATLTGKAWKALEAKKWDEVTAFTEKCIEMFKDKAVEQQKALTEIPTEKEKVFSNWALNDVGVCYFIKAQALEKQDKKKEASDAYKILAEKLPFAQCWDTNGWFWNPSEAAKERIKVLEFDSLK